MAQLARSYLLTQVISRAAYNLFTLQEHAHLFTQVAAPRWEQLSSEVTDLVLNASDLEGSEGEHAQALVRRAAAHLSVYQQVVRDNTIADDDVVLVVEEGTILSVDWYRRVQHLVQEFTVNPALQLMMLSNDHIYDLEYNAQTSEQLAEVRIITDALTKVTDYEGVDLKLAYATSLKFNGASAYLVRKAAIRAVAQRSVEMVGLEQASVAQLTQAQRAPVSWRPEAWHLFFSFTRRAIAHALPVVGLACYRPNGEQRLVPENHRRINFVQHKLLRTRATGAEFTKLQEQLKGESRELAEQFTVNWSATDAAFIDPFVQAQEYGYSHVERMPKFVVADAGKHLPTPTSYLGQFFAQEDTRDFQVVQMPRSDDPQLQEILRATEHQESSDVYHKDSEQRYTVNRLRWNLALREIYNRIAADQRYHDNQFVLIARDSAVLDPAWKNKLRHLLGLISSFVPECEVLALSKGTITDFKYRSLEELKGKKIYAGASFVHPVGFLTAGFLATTSRAELAQQAAQPALHLVAQTPDLERGAQVMQAHDYLKVDFPSAYGGEIAHVAREFLAESGNDFERGIYGKPEQRAELLHGWGENQLAAQQLEFAAADIPTRTTYHIDRLEELRTTRAYYPLLNHAYYCSDYQRHPLEVVAINVYNISDLALFAVRVGEIRKRLEYINGANFNGNDITKLTSGDVYNTIHSNPCLAFIDPRAQQVEMQGQLDLSQGYDLLSQSSPLNPMYGEFAQRLHNTAQGNVPNHVARIRKYLINMDSQPERLEFMHQQRGIASFERVPAVRGSDLTDAEKAQVFDIERSQQHCGRGLVNGEYGCTLSHCEVYKRILADDSIADHEFVLISEDDSQYHPQWQQRLNQTLEYIYSNKLDHINLILGAHIFLTELEKVSPEKLETTQYLFTDPTDCLTINPEQNLYYIYKYYPHGSSCYLVRKGALRQFSERIHKPYWVADDFAQCVQFTPTSYVVMNPPLSYQNTDLPSTIADQRYQSILDKRKHLQSLDLGYEGINWLGKHNYVIQLTLSTAEIKAKFPGFEIIPFEDYRKMSAEEFANWYDMDGFVEYYKRKPTDEEINRALAHMRCLRMIGSQEDGVFSFCLIVEDDAELHPQYREVSNMAVRYLDTRLGLHTHLILISNDRVPQQFKHYSFDELSKYIQIEEKGWYRVNEKFDMVYCNRKQLTGCKGYLLLNAVLREGYVHKRCNWLADDFPRFLTYGEDSIIYLNPPAVADAGSEIFEADYNLGKLLPPLV